MDTVESLSRKFDFNQAVIDDQEVGHFRYMLNTVAGNLQYLGSPLERFHADLGKQLGLGLIKFSEICKLFLNAGVKPDEDTFNSVLDRFEGSKHEQEAQNRVKELRALDSPDELHY